MNQVTIIFPNQLFKNHPGIQKDRKILLIEEKRFFTDFKFHVKKLILHRASMKAYFHFLSKKGYDVEYIEYNKDWKNKVKDHEIILVKPFDVQLEKRIPKKAVVLENPSFLGGDLKKAKKYIMGNFYKKQRARLDILMDGEKPSGGKWSFDKENRKKLPKDHKLPTIKRYDNQYVKEAIRYVKKNFPDNPGDYNDFIYPVTFEEADKHLGIFVKERLKLFGDYEDAISQDHDVIYHSILSSSLNIGLLTPRQILDAVLKSKVPINSKEGFIRQIIGWREFILKIYLLEGENQRASNFFNAKRKLPDTFYYGETGIEPVDNVIKKVLKNAYCHHIERLMILTNYMLLKGYSPNEIYRWFMEMFIDAYDWVMVPNIYGMALYADGGLMSSKPYISSSNYILKMSDFKKGKWCDEWNNLYWDFLKLHKNKLKNNPRMALMLRRV